MKRRARSLAGLAALGLGLAAVVWARTSARELDLTTGLLFLGAVCALLFLLAELAMLLLGVAAGLRANLRLLLVTTGALLFGSELFLRFGLDRYATYHERQGHGYEPLEFERASWFLVHEPDSEARFATQDFVLLRRTNSLGLAERAIPLQKAPGEYRIIALGDSFTEGVGAEYESSWVKVMERELAAKLPDRQITTMNAGIGGSDIFFEFMLLKEKLLDYAPDLVIVATNTTDVDDFLLRGGMERFSADGRYRSPRATPPWEWLYGISYITRHVVRDWLHYDWFFLKKERLDDERRKGIEQIRSLLPAFAELGRAKGFRFVLVLHPRAVVESVQGAYLYGFDRVIAEAPKIQAAVKVIDVLAYCRAHGIMTGSAAQRYFWPADGHFNTEGYAVMGRAVASELLALGLERDVR